MIDIVVRRKIFIGTWFLIIANSLRLANNDDKKIEFRLEILPLFHVQLSIDTKLS